ncbi:hypothetical protein [Nostoc sp. LPT]|uniref:hypothetical protein n=1 Tax=Nostoc sp. LPT TaxID=2815387 RepID=UPI001D2AE03A|nr:hypothetical protein [Nostoc sp. LPT]MBN4005664.1 hypothetical protein [Nostoc sp. LPT]
MKNPVSCFSWNNLFFGSPLCPVTNQAIANQSFDSLDELESVLFQRCKLLSNERDLIRGLTYYHWWPETNNNLTVCI